MIERMFRATKLDVDLYEEVEHDQRYTTEAFLIVLIVSLLSALGALFIADDGGSRVALFAAALVIGLLGWVVWAVIADFVGRTFFGATSDVGEMLRVIGYAQSVLVLAVIPFLGFLASIWSLVCLVVALRQGLDISTGKAIAVGIIGWLVIFIASVLVYAILV
jgi:hypothetical protein